VATAHGFTREYQADEIGWATPETNDHLIALWTHGVAVEYDPGMTTTLTLSRFADHSLTGIDILSGYRQEMTVDWVDGNLIIRDLLVKDCPMVLQLRSTKTIPLPLALKGHTH